MSILGRIERKFRGAITESHELARMLRAGWATSSGAEVTVESALTLGAVFSCVRVLSESLAQLPLHLFQKTVAGRERASDHPVDRLLRRPNEWQTGFGWKEMSQAHLVLTGNAYSLKTVVRGEIRELLPLPPGRVEVEQDDRYRLHYHVTLPNGQVLEVPQERMLHVPGLSWNGVQGLSVIRYMRESIGTGLQQGQYAGRLYSNGAQIRGVMKHPKKLSDEAQKRLKAQFDEVYSGVENAHKVMLLEEGAEFQKTGMTAEDAQFLESRKFTRSDIASWFRVPPHLIGDLERATFSNIEQQALEFVQFTLMPWLVRWEEQLSASLLSDKDQAVFYPKFVVQGLLRGAYKDRVEGYKVAIESGWMNRNEARELEDMNHVPGLDEFLIPLNMGDGGKRPGSKEDST